MHGANRNAWIRKETWITRSDCFFSRNDSSDLYNWLWVIPRSMWSILKLKDVLCRCEINLYILTYICSLLFASCHIDKQISVRFICFFFFFNLFIHAIVILFMFLHISESFNSDSRFFIRLFAFLSVHLLMHSLSRCTYANDSVFVIPTTYHVIYIRMYSDSFDTLVMFFSLISFLSIYLFIIYLKYQLQYSIYLNLSTNNLRNWHSSPTVWATQVKEFNSKSSFE